MAKGDPVTSPHVLYRALDNEGRELRVTLTFNAARTVTGITTFRDPNCTYRKLLIGVGGDGRPDSSPRALPVRAGNDAATQQELNGLAAAGLVTVENYQSLQITASP